MSSRESSAKVDRAVHARRQDFDFFQKKTKKTKKFVRSVAMLAPKLTISTIMILSGEVQYTGNPLRPANNSPSYTILVFAMGGCIRTFFSAGVRTFSIEINLRGVEWSCLMSRMGCFRGWSCQCHTTEQPHADVVIYCTFTLLLAFVEGLAYLYIQVHVKTLVRLKIKMQLNYIIVLVFLLYCVLWEYVSHLNRGKKREKNGKDGIDCRSQDLISREKLHENLVDPT